MNFASKLNQTIVYWAPSGLNDYGRTTFAGGVEFTGRWQREAKIFTDNTGEERVSDSKVFANSDDITLETDGRLFLGALTDLTAPQQADPNLVPSAEIIRKLLDSPGISAVQKLTTVLTNRG